MLKQYIIDVTTQAINAAVKNGKLNQMKQEDVFTLNAETPKNEEFGDFAVKIFKNGSTRYCAGCF